MLSINTNTSSLIAQNSLKTSTSRLNQAIERMSSGAKINHAKDNAANYSIATNYSTKLSALQVAEDNVNMGLDMVQTTESALSQIADSLSRIRALAVQSQNGTYGNQSLSALNSEASSLLAEINRINESATFNGIKLFSSGKKDVTNIGKELNVNPDCFVDEISKIDTSSLTKFSSVDSTVPFSVDEYSISTKEDLIKLAEMTNNGLVEAGSTFVLTNNIDLSGVKWQVIGVETSKFEGNFNGNGYTISNLTDSGSNWTPMGLFGYISNSNISNIKMVNTKITGGQNCGSIAAVASDSVIKNCSSINAYFSGGWNQGGIVSDGTNSIIEACYVSGDITGYIKVGGIAYTASSINRCYFNGSVSGTQGVGGICGDGMNGYMNGCRTAGFVKCKNSNAGGITGLRGHFQDCYSDATITGKNTIGGITGVTQATQNFFNNIFEGTVTGEESVGVFIGNAMGTGSNYKIENCSYYSGNNLDIPLVGSGVKDTIINVQDLYIPTEYSLQVGIEGNNTSTLSYTTLINFSGLKSLLDSGLNNPDLLTKIDEISVITANKASELGVIQNKLESVLEQISVSCDNLVSSRSTIMDADIAELSAEYIKMQILQQASATLMATANQSPAIALQLL